MPQFKMQVLNNIMLTRFPSEGKWQTALKNATAEWTQASLARPVKQISIPRRPWRGLTRV